MHGIERVQIWAMFILLPHVSYWEALDTLYLPPFVSDHMFYFFLFFIFFGLYILLYSQQILTPKVFKIEGTITIEQSRHVLKLNT